MRTNYLYPVKIMVGPSDLAWRWALTVCLLSILVPVWFLPDLLAALVVVLSITCLRFIWDTQFIIRKAVALVGNRPGDWHVETHLGHRDYVELKSIDRFGMFIIVKIKHFGSCSYLIQIKSRIAKEQLHKLNLLSMSKVA